MKDLWGVPVLDIVHKGIFADCIQRKKFRKIGDKGRQDLCDMKILRRGKVRLKFDAIRLHGSQEKVITRECRYLS